MCREVLWYHLWIALEDCRLTRSWFIPEIAKRGRPPITICCRWNLSWDMFSLVHGRRSLTMRCATWIALTCSSLTWIALDRLDALDLRFDLYIWSLQGSDKSSTREESFLFIRKYTVCDGLVFHTTPKFFCYYFRLSVFISKKYYQNIHNFVWTYLWCTRFHLHL